MNTNIDALIAASSSSAYGWYPPPVFGGGAASGGSGGEPANFASDRASDYSDTNTQVEGVDEADIVKNDGNFVYLLHGNRFMVLDAWPASSLGQVSSFEIEGQPSEMYVAGEDAVVYSTVDGTPIYAAAGIEPRPGYSDAIWYGGIAPGIAPRATADAAIAPYPGWFYEPLTKITVLRLLAGEPAVVRELYFEGSYLSSRRVDTKVRSVIVGGAHGPAVKYVPEDYTTLQTPADWRNAYEKLRADNTAAIQASTYSDWLPTWFVRNGSDVTASQPACEDFYMPTAGSTDFGMTSVVAIDAAIPEQAPESATIMGAVDTVYGTADGLYLAGRSWTDPGPVMSAWTAGGGDGGSGGAVSDGGTVQPGEGGAPIEPPPEAGGAGSLTQAQEAIVSLNRTHLHRFTFVNGSSPVYVASGSIDGNINDQFSIDEHAGYLRVATTEDRVVGSTWTFDRVNDLFVLETVGDELRATGAIRNLAPDERIYSARFLGDLGYIVTFRQVDPLFAVDLKDPAHPVVIGQLDIPGFSEYMHPIDEGHLFTVGRDDGVALQLFDVTNPASPQLAAKYVFTGDQWGYTEVSDSHKALTYYASRGIVAFPYVAYGDTEPGYRSSLELFHVDAAGIARLGSIDHSSFFSEAPSGYCGGYYGVQVRRGVFMEDFVYAISYGGVTAHALSDLHTVATLPLPQPQSELPVCGVAE